MTGVQTCALPIWSDIGSWKAMSELYETDAAGNSIRGKAVMVDSTNCFVQGVDRVVAAVGVKDLVIVDTVDAVLVADRHQAQDVKEVVTQLSELKHEAVIFHKTVHRPWGSYTILEDAEDCKVKRLVVKPGQVLSLQLHHRRAEHWTVVRGTAKVRLEPGEPGLTVLHYQVTAQVGGKLAQVGSRLVDMAAQKMARDFFEKFDLVLLEVYPPAEQPAAQDKPPAKPAGLFARLLAALGRLFGR